MKFLVVVPAYNEMPQVVEFAKELLGYRYDVLFVDDGSTDGTFQALKELGANVVRHESNKGKGEALKTGFHYALEKDYDAVITMDADGQHDPKYIPVFLKELRRYDIVLGSRRKFMNLRNMPFDRYMVNRITSTIVSLLSGKLIEDPQSGFRGISRNVLSSLSFETSRYDFETEFLVKSLRYGFKLTHVSIPVIYGSERSHINKLKDTFRAIRLYLKLVWL